MRFVFLIYLITGHFLTPFSKLHAMENFPLPELLSPSALLMDVQSGDILYEQDADRVLPPASMTKLMTLHIVYKGVKEKKYRLEDLVPVSSKAAWQNQPPRSSLMFIEPGQKVTLLELMKGLAISSGNDAAVAIAEFTVGSVRDFTEQMNREAQNLGLKETFFTEPSGISIGNRTTPRDFARFFRHYIVENPEAFIDIHRETSFAYPTKKNGPTSKGLILQYQRDLIGGTLWVDGLKTGYIKESGLNIAVTASQGNRQVLAVLMGLPRNNRLSEVQRSYDALQLLTYGLYGFQNFFPGVESIPPVAVAGGDKELITPQQESLSPLTLPLTQWAQVKKKIVLPAWIEAPVHKGEVLGHIEYSVQGQTILKQTLFASENITRISDIGAFIDKIRFHLFQ